MKLKKTLIDILVGLSRLIVGVTFVFSGFVKAVDPHGFGYKIEDYLVSMGLTELLPLALPAAILLSDGELLMGLYIILGIYRKTTSVFILLFMLVMTPLTLWIALKNPVADCGCFGDALIISNWATFYKNIVLLLAAIMLFAFRNRINSFFSNKTIVSAALFCALASITFAVFNVINRPIIDFRPFSIGSHIPTNMYVDPTKADQYENILIYEKDGIKKEFTEENYPWDDSTWTYVDMTSRLVKKGEKPKIEDFSIIRLEHDSSTGVFSESEEITDQVLMDQNYSFLVISTDLKGINNKEQKQLELIEAYANNYGYKLYYLTSSSKDDVAVFYNKRYNKNVSQNIIYGLADERTLKTVVRANPGLILLRNGIVINKWDANSLPKAKELNKPLEDSVLSTNIDTEKNNVTSLLVIILLFVLPIACLKVIDYTLNKRAISRT